MAFSPDGNYFLTGDSGQGARLFRKVPELPDDLDRVATWVEVLTGLTLDAGQGTIQVLDNTAWRERREQLEQRGGPPETGGGPRLDPILFGTDPIARGRVLMERGRWDEAIAEWKRFVELDPKNARAHYDLANALKAKGDLDGAIAAFSKAIEIDPNLAPLRLARGETLCRMDRFREAIADFDVATKLDPNNHFGWHQAAALYLYNGDVERYRRACREMLDDRFEKRAADEASVAEQTAKTCALAPDAVPDFVASSGWPSARHGHGKTILVSQLRPHQGIDRLPRRAPRAGRRAAEAVRTEARPRRLGRHRLRRPGHGASPARPRRAGAPRWYRPVPSSPKNPIPNGGSTGSNAKSSTARRRGSSGGSHPRSWPPRRPRSNSGNSPRPRKRSASGRTTA